ncbi:hypothetical protein C8J57DRAFT_1213823 [Mycena rebaudengoi]|nr:hypothetical protein C8J57DRAFT_1213823 [Mycena rebaudengoi]
MKFIHPTLGFAPWELELFGCTHEVYRPLCAFIGLLVNSSFPEGDSPLDFLFDFQRAGPLYEDSHYTAKVAVIRWMHTVKTLINGQDQGQGVYWDIWDLPSQVVLHEIETLDLSQLCDLVAMDPIAHGLFHKSFRLDDSFDCVIGWLRVSMFPPPLQDQDLIRLISLALSQPTDAHNRSLGKTESRLPQMWEVRSRNEISQAGF